MNREADSRKGIATKRGLSGVDGTRCFYSWTDEQRYGTCSSFASMKLWVAEVADFMHSRSDVYIKLNSSPKPHRSWGLCSFERCC